MTGLIYVAIIALWAAVLIPIWLRRHESDEIKAVDRFDGAMTALRGIRRGSRGAIETEVSVKGAGRTEHPVSTAAARRRKVLVVLAAVFVVAVISWILGWLPIWAPLVVVALFAAFVFLARKQVVAETRATRTSRKARPTNSTRAAYDEDYKGAPPPRSRRREERVYADIDAEYTQAHEEELARPRRRDPLRPTGSWEAMPQNLPTYVDAPSASAVPRRIDRVTGAWDSQAMLDQVRVQRDRAAAADFFDQTQDYEDQRRASGA
ncbi:MAG: hypothetical protein NT180_10245 [Actinobacteria bacterium]|nr:hypothetical protein [Actinomycetota bacterium]